MMLTAVGLLVGLGIYVYLGARAETILLSQRPAMNAVPRPQPEDRRNDAQRHVFDMASLRERSKAV